MALFGKGFSDSQPTDAEYVTRTAGSGDNAATGMRALKQRIKDFFGEMFDLDNGKFLTNSVSSDSLQPLSPNPEGTFREVTVNAKGLVTGGVEDPEGEPKYRLRAYFSADPTFQSIYETKEGKFINIPFATGLKIMGATLDFSDDGKLYTPTQGFYYRRLDFFTPDRVTEIKYYLFQPYSVTYNTKGSCRIGTFYTYKDQQIKLILGTDESLVSGVLGSRIRVADYSKDIGTGTDGMDHDPFNTHTDYFKSSSTNYGESPYSNIAKLITPGYGFAMLEWFEV